jgi:hypothetical protein
MSEVLELTTDEPKLDTAGKRALIEKALAENPQHPDREIARTVGHGVDHKTVGAARERLGNSPQAPAEAATTEKPVINVIPRGATVIHPPPPGTVDVPEDDPFKPDSEDLVIPHQPAIAVYANVAGGVTVRQERADYQDEDPLVVIRPEHIEKVVAALRKAAKEAGQ